MAEINVQFVRPDRLLFEGPVASLVLVTPTGELGIWPQHDALICALGDGVIRLHQREEDGGGTVRVINSGGYAEVENDTVIVLADHARLANDVEPEVVRATRVEAASARDALDPADPRRAYYENKISWCDLLLRYGTPAE